MLNIPGRNIHREPMHEVGSSRIRLASGVLLVQLWLRQTLWASRNSSAPKDTMEFQCIIGVGEFVAHWFSPFTPDRNRLVSQQLNTLTTAPSTNIIPRSKNMFVSLQSECIEIQKAG